MEVNKSKFVYLKTWFKTYGVSHEVNEWKIEDYIGELKTAVIM